MTIELQEIPELPLQANAVWTVRALGNSPALDALANWSRKNSEPPMKRPHHSPISADIPEVLREELERTPPVTPEMLAELAAANRRLNADPEFQADLLKGLFVEQMLEALEDRGETKAQLAERLGKTRQYIQKLFDEDKRVNFTVDTLCAVAHALGRCVQLHICRAEEAPMILPKA